MGCGLHKPHVPWVFPAEFRAQLPAVDTIPLLAWGYEPSDMPPVAWHGAADDLADGGQLNSNNPGYGPGFDADPVLSNLTNWTTAGGRDANTTRTYRLAYYSAVACKMSKKGAPQRPLTYHTPSDIVTTCHSTPRHLDLLGYGAWFVVVFGIQLGPALLTS